MGYFLIRFAIVFWPALYVSVVLHELGHYVMARLVGTRVAMVVIGRTTWAHFRLNGTVFSFGSPHELMGFMLPATDGLTMPARFGQIVTTSGGIVAHACIIVVSGIWLLVSGWEIAGMFLIVNVIMLVANAIPMQHARIGQLRIPNDGRKLLNLFRNTSLNQTSIGTILLNCSVLSEKCRKLDIEDQAQIYDSVSCLLRLSLSDRKPADEYVQRLRDDRRQPHAIEALLEGYCLLLDQNPSVLNRIEEWRRDFAVVPAAGPYLDILKAECLHRFGGDPLGLLEPIVGSDLSGAQRIMGLSAEVLLLKFKPPADLVARGRTWLDRAKGDGSLAVSRLEMLRTLALATRDERAEHLSWCRQLILEIREVARSIPFESTKSAFHRHWQEALTETIPAETLAELALHEEAPTHLTQNRRSRVVNIIRFLMGMAIGIGLSCLGILKLIEITSDLSPNKFGRLGTLMSLGVGAGFVSLFFALVGAIIERRWRSYVVPALISVAVILFAAAHVQIYERMRHELIVNSLDDTLEAGDLTEPAG